MKTNLENLKEMDVYSLVLFSLYKLIGTSEYSSIAELAYVLDKDSLLNLCEYFGGQTIRIPTIDEIELLVIALLLVKYVKVDNMPYEEALAQISTDHVFSPKKVKQMYMQLKEVLDKYEFKSRESY